MLYILKEDVHENKASSLTGQKHIRLRNRDLGKILEWYLKVRIELSKLSRRTLVF